MARYQGERYVKPFRCLDQYLAMAFAQQLARHRSLSARPAEHLGLRCTRVARNTLSKANERRDWRMYAYFAHALILIARPLSSDENLGLSLDNTVYALDASTTDLCLSVFPWALFRATKSAVKRHTLLDLRGNIPTFVHISDGKLHDVNMLDILQPEPGAFDIMDRGYEDFRRLFTLHTAGAFFVIRAKSNTKYRLRYPQPVDKSGGVRCDQTIVLTGVASARAYPQALRRVKYYDRPSGKTFNFLTNNFAVPAQTLADLYRYRWQVELFFIWIKQHLCIKSFFGTSENAVKNQIWIALSVYVLVAIIKKRLDIRADFYTILQILSLTVFERTPLIQLLTQDLAIPNRLNLFDNLTG